MTFLNPFVLFGLIAAGVPILIHLLQLKKLRTIEFSSIRFLKEIQHASAKRVKLRDYLLLLLRSLAIACLVLAFARPALKGIGISNSKTAAVFILDDSPSTTARNEYGEIFSQLKTVASSLIDKSMVGDNIDLLFMSHLSGSGFNDTSRVFSTINPHSLLPLISRAEPSNVRVYYSSAIEAALKKLGPSNYINKEIYLIGDLQQSEFNINGSNGNSQPRPASLSRANIRLFFLQTDETSNNNLSISNVRFLDPVVEINASSEVHATVVNNGGTEKDGVVVSLYLDGRKVSQSSADLPAGGSRNVGLAFNVANAGFHEGVVEIDDNSIQQDNRFYFSFFAVRKLKVLVVTSKQENDFVLGAVNAVSGGDSSASIVAKVVSPNQFVYSDLSNVDVVVVEEYSDHQNGSSITQSFEGKLIQFARNGGGVVLFGPPVGQVNAFNELLNAMGIGRTSGFFSSAAGNFLSIDKIDAGDEFFAGIFSSKESANQIRDQLVTKISQMVQVQANPFDHILMSASTSPFLISREVGGGFAFVIASPADSLSSTFPMSPFFPVVVQRALFYSAAVKHKPIQIHPGGSVDYTYSSGGIKSATLTAPDGNKSEVVPTYVGGAAKFSLHDLVELGTYSLADESPFCGISVNVDPHESDLSQATRSRVIDFATSLGFSSKNVFLLKADRNTASSIDKLRRGQDLSSWFAGAALIFLVLEIFVSKMKIFSGSA
jgi:hypothetical protein